MSFLRWGKDKGANLTRPDRGTAKRLGQRYGRPRPFGAYAFRLCPRSLKNSRFPVRPSDYAKFVRIGRFKTRTPVPSTLNSGRDRLRVAKPQTESAVRLEGSAIARRVKTNSENLAQGLEMLVFGVNTAGPLKGQAADQNHQPCTLSISSLVAG